MSELAQRHVEDTVAPGGPPAPDQDRALGPSRLARRRRLLLLTTVLAAVAAGGGLAAASLVKSPAERAADTAPPPPTLITAPVTSRVLTRSTVVRGQVYPPTRYDVAPAAASTEITQLYLSEAPVRAGDQVANGQLLAEVSGQPLFVLRGAVPAYRDLKPGSSGGDVTELRAALEELGFDSGSDPEGSYGRGTAAAVTAYYRSLGYRPPTTGPATQQAVDAARRQVDGDQAALDALREQAAAPTPPPTTPGRPGLDRQLADARRKLTESKEALAAAEAVNGPMVPAGEVVFLPGLPATVTAVNGAVGAPVSGALLSLTSGPLAVTGQLSPAQAAGITPGMAVEILSESTGRTIRGTVADLGTPATTPPAGRVVPIGAAAAAPAGAGQGGPGAAPGQGGQAGPNQAGQVPAYVPVRITPAEPLPADFSGQNVRITVLRDAAAAPVLSVPVAAVSTDASGRTSVTRVDPDGQRTTVPVAAGVSAAGFVGVTPADGARLREGDLVAVGR
ncbi:peptidoglycan-binding protein [Kitasatospora camelliae]|uniref:Peptidoglycan-binding protein n=1 Tax=Kitasatospora camelliae TaxID=3156397 RepID=A0AAU8JXM1_9ACTN